MQIFYKLLKKFSFPPFFFATFILGLVAYSVFNGEVTSLEMPPSLNTSAVGVGSGQICLITRNVSSPALLSYALWSANEIPLI